MLDVMKLQYKTANLLQFGMLVIGRIFFLFETVEIQPQNTEKLYCYHCFSERSFRQKHITYKSHEQYVSSPFAFPCSLTFLEQKQEHSPEGAIKAGIIIITIVQPTLLLGLTSPQSFNRSEDNELKENCITVRKKIVIFLQNVYWYLIFFFLKCWAKLNKTMSEVSSNGYMTCYKKRKLLIFLEPDLITG